jgi:protein-disulfide isomerase
MKGKKEEKKIAFNPWMISTILLLIVFVAFAFSVYKPSDKDKIGQSAIDFINNNLVEGVDKATLVSVEEDAGLYKVTTSYKGQNIPVYVTKDGKYMFLSQPLDMSQSLPKPQQNTGKFDAPDKDVPDVELYVMSFCPFGVQAENTMKPVFDLLKDKVNFKIRFIANVNGDDYKSVSSLHGFTEAMEDLRQICIMKYYSKETYWNYLIDFNAKCYSSYRDEKALDACWREVAKKFNIDDKRIDDCSKSKEALDLLKVDEQLTTKYGVRGSPTLIINGATYNGARTPEAFKQAVCSGFKNPPSECNQTLEGSTVSTSGPSGGCGV